MKNFLLVLFLIFSNLTAYGLTAISGITTVTGRGNIANRTLESSSNGKAMAIWTESSFSTQVQAAYFNGTNWLAQNTLATGNFPQVGVASSGKAYAIWLNTSNTGSSQVFTASFNPAANSWSTPIQLSNSGINSAPQIAVNSQGNALAIWIQNYPPSIEATTFNASTSTWSATTTLINGAVTFPQVTLNDSNNGIVMWFGPTFGIEAISVSVP